MENLVNSIKYTVERTALCSQHLYLNPHIGSCKLLKLEEAEWKFTFVLFLYLPFKANFKIKSRDNLPGFGYG